MIILAIANDYPHKDITTIFKTLAILRATDPDRNWLLCVLGEGAWHAHYGPILHELQIESAVLFPGYVTSSDIAQYFRQAFALITASRLEAFNNTPLEAMGYGIPAIASNCCAHPEVVGTAGVLIEPGDSNAFAIAIHSLANDHAAYIEMVNRGRKHIEFFRIDDMADNFMEIIQQTTLSMEKKCSKKKHC